MEKKFSYEIFALGDSALTFDLGNRICDLLNQKVLAMQEWVSQHPFEGMKELVLGYSSLSVIYDPFTIQKKYKLHATAFDFVKAKLEEAYLSSSDVIYGNGEQINIPVCYEGNLGPDISFIAEKKQIDVEQVINLHISKTYRVYMMGFLPGFAYMGEVDERIQVCRKQKPEMVKAGSVGIANGQTGIYPLDSPGGWQIIGRTPLSLFNANAIPPVKLKAGQFIKFQRISLSDFEQICRSQTQ